jgi:hypothetical protein
LRGFSEPPPPSIEVGTRLGEFSGFNMVGMMDLVMPPKQSTEKLLLITMSPGCPICRANLAGWIRLTEDIKRLKGWRVIWSAAIRLSIQSGIARRITYQSPMFWPTHPIALMLNSG